MELNMGGCNGSPPRVRGRVLGLINIVPHDGLTPARAGKRLRKARNPA